MTTQVFGEVLLCGRETLAQRHGVTSQNRLILKHRCENLKPCTLIYKYKNLLHISVCCTHMLTMLFK